MVRPSAFAETVTPPIVSPDADLTVPVSRTVFSAAQAIFGTNAPGARTTMLTRKAEKKLRLLLITRSPYLSNPMVLAVVVARRTAFRQLRLNLQEFDDSVVPFHGIPLYTTHITGRPSNSPLSVA